MEPIVQIVRNLFGSPMDPQQHAANEAARLAAASPSPLKNVWQAGQADTPASSSALVPSARPPPPSQQRSSSKPGFALWGLGTKEKRVSISSEMQLKLKEYESKLTDLHALTHQQAAEERERERARESERERARESESESGKARGGGGGGVARQTAPSSERERDDVLVEREMTSPTTSSESV